MSLLKKSKSQLGKNITGAGLSRDATEILVENLNALTEAGAQGIGIDDLTSDENTLVCVILDETGSMDDDRDAVISSFNEMVRALKDSKASDKILLSVWAFNTKRRLIHSYLPLELVPDLTDYYPNDQTALFDAVLDGFTSLVAYEQDLQNLGNRTQAIVAVFSDGEDNASRVSARDVERVAVELLDKESYVLALVTFGQGFARQVAAEMGFPNVLEVGATPTEIRRAMGTFSKSAIRASQTKIGSGSQSGFFTT